MTELLTAAQMRAIEQAAIESGEVTGLELMERAGRGVVEAIFEEWPELAKTSHRAVVLCGPGNNGGDGFVVARLLKDWGWEVEVFLYGDPEKLPPDARVNFERWEELRGQTSPIATDDSPGTYGAAAKVISEADLFVDALFGVGLSRAAPYLEAVSYSLHSCFADARFWTGEFSKPRFVAIDVPSSICANSGRELAFDDRMYLTEPYAAYLTVAFHRPKIGHHLNRGPTLCHSIRIVDIGLSENEAEHYVSSHPMRYGTFLTRSPREDFEVFQRLKRQNGGHKFSHGHALVLAGHSGKGGAARLAARGAIRVGAGLVTVACPPDALIENSSQLNTIMTAPAADTIALKEILHDKRINAICAGPGLGVGETTREMVELIVSRGSGAVLDADALASFADDPVALFELIRGTNINHVGKLDRQQIAMAFPDEDPDELIARQMAPITRVVLTPHGGEFKRLFPDIAEKLDAPATKGPAYSKVDATREAAARAGCVVLFKGPDTVIAAADGRCSINSAHYDRAAPWLATAGSGDVLAGFITGLLARGFPPMQAAETAAWLHVECARKFGPGLIAEDLPEQLPAVFRDLGL